MSQRGFSERPVLRLRRRGLERQRPLQRPLPEITNGPVVTQVVFDTPQRESPALTPLPGLYTAITSMAEARRGAHNEVLCSRGTIKVHYHP